MGRRGRQKAKQTRVARELKYHSGPTDLDQLQRELAAERHSADPTEADPTDVMPADGEDDGDEAYDYRSYADAYADEDEDQPANGTYRR